MLKTLIIIAVYVVLGKRGVTSVDLSSWLVQWPALYRLACGLWSNWNVTCGLDWLAWLWTNLQFERNRGLNYN